MIRWTPARLASAISKIGPSLPGRSSVPRAISLLLQDAGTLQRWDLPIGLGAGVPLHQLEQPLGRDAGLDRRVRQPRVDDALITFACNRDERFAAACHRLDLC